MSLVATYENSTLSKSFQESIQLLQVVRSCHATTLHRFHSFCALYTGTALCVAGGYTSKSDLKHFP
jgi:hypothetical protein